MQLIVNGNQTHVLDVSPEADVACLRAQLSMLEGVDCEQLNLFCSGAPLEDDVNLAVLEHRSRKGSTARSQHLPAWIAGPSDRLHQPLETRPARGSGFRSQSTAS